MRVSIRIFQKDKVRSDGKYPIYLRITKNLKQKLISLGFYCTKNEWDQKKEKFKKNYPNHVKRNIILSNTKNRALAIIDNFIQNKQDFTLNQFEELFRGQKSSDKVRFFDFVQSKIDDLKKAGRTGNHKVYKETLLSFKKFLNGINPNFEDITVDLLEQYEIHLRGNGGTSGGISIRMRTIRAVYNDAINKGVANSDHYPFRKYQISKLKGQGLKRALTRDEVRLIENLNVEEHPYLIDAKNYFVFSYYTRGMNFIDMLKLKWNENITENTISYTRSKTHKNFVVKILPPVKLILDYYKEAFPETNYVFPILLKEGLNANQIENRKDKTLKKYNKDLKAVAKVVGINKTLTSYVARHSFATNLKQAGVKTAIISESMGHKNQEITETYLKAFENEIIDQATEKLL